MPRSSVGAADQRLIGLLASVGASVSPYQLERWRTLGLMPRNIRRGLGRGRGSFSEPADDALACARFLCLCTRNSHHIVENVVWNFYEVSAVSPSHANALPETPIRGALLLNISRQSSSEIDEDLAYIIAEDKARRDTSFTARTFHHARAWGLEFDALRRGDLSTYDELRARSRQSRRSLSTLRPAYAHVMAAERLGVEAVGYEMVRESIVELAWASVDESEKSTRFLALTLGRSMEALA